MAISDEEEKNLVRRAYAAYFRSGANQQPAAAMSGMRSVGTLQYVVLRNSEGVLGVYRVRNDGVLKGLKRWPAQLEE
jgi:hypothetical protein